MNKVRFEKDGQEVSIEDLNYSQEATREAFYGLLSGFGINPNKSFILSGCEATLTDWNNPTKVGDNIAITEGYISLNGEILKVDAQNINVLTGQACYFLLDVDRSIASPRKIKGGVDYEAQEQRRGKLTTSAAPPTDRMDYNSARIESVLRNKVYHKAMPMLFNPSIIGETMSDYFDESTGLGIIGREFEGWAMMDGRNSTPDWTEKFVVGYNKDNLSEYDLNVSGGLKQVTLVESELPEVKIGGDTTPLPGYSGGGSPIFTTDAPADPDSPNSTFRNLGGGDPHENRPPYVVAAWVVRIQ